MTDNATSKARDDLEKRIDAIESGYEFMLAYAAQGRRTDRDVGGEHGVRAYLERMAAALDGLGAVARKCVGERGLDDVDPFLAAIEADALTTLAIVKLVLAQSDISSQLIDNLNASIHVRALLTDMFIVDEAFKAKRQA